MKETLQPGIKHTFSFSANESKTVPSLYSESDELQAMPKVLDLISRGTHERFIIYKDKFDQKMKNKPEST
jgi:predicted thioesterase